jgi:hypothetical protein
MSWLAGQKDGEGDEHDNLGVDWVLQYDFGEIGKFNKAYTLLAI